MARYIIRRILQFIPVLIAISLFTFVLMQAIPGGPFDFVGDRSLPPTIIANLEAKYHLDWPLWKQYLSYMIGDDILGEVGESRGVIRGDFGPSYHFRGQTVADIIKITLPISAQLGFMSLLLAIIIGIPTGIIAALNHCEKASVNIKVVANPKQGEELKGFQETSDIPVLNSIDDAKAAL